MNDPKLSQRPSENRDAEAPGLLAVSLHDVSPVNWEKCESILTRLDALGVHRRILLVIPDYRDSAPVDGAGEAFIAWLKKRSKRDEVCLHGYSHRAEAIQGGPIARLVATLYTNREGEFYQLPEERAKELLREGLARFERIGLHPEGFVAPAWLLSPEVPAALREMGFRYTTRLGHIDLLQENPPRSLRAPALCYSVRSAWRRAVSRLWNPLLARRNRETPILRVAIHPVDIDHPDIFEQIMRLTSEALKTRGVATYLEIAGIYGGLDRKERVR